MSNVVQTAHLQVATTDGDINMSPSNRQMEATRGRTVSAAAQLPALPPTPRGFIHSPLSLTAVSTPEHVEISVFFSDREMNANPSHQQATIFTIPSPLKEVVVSSDSPPHYTPAKRKFTY